MNKKKAVTVFFLSLLCLTIVGNIFAQTAGSVGVQQGNMFKYNLVVNWSSTDQNDTVPTDLFIQNQTEYFQVTVQEVTGTTVWFEAITHYSDEYEVKGTHFVDVNTGDGNCTFVYAANLTQGNYLFPGSTIWPWAIDETGPRRYQNSGFRQTNHISVIRTDIEGQTYSRMNLYFDQATGIVVESIYTYANTATPQQTVTQHLTLTESNVWAFSPPPVDGEEDQSASPTPTGQGSTPSPTSNAGSTSTIDPLIIVLVLVVAIVLIIAVLVMKRGGKKSQKQPSAQAPSAPATAAAQTKLICSKCGQENPKGSEFCNKCGVKLRD